jgi:hypothetical protein
MPSRWSRFNYAKTIKTGGRKLYRDLILKNLANISVKGGVTHRRLVGQIAQESNKPIPIESLPDTLDGKVGPRGQTIFGFSGDYIDRIAGYYESMWWWISATGLNMGAVSPPSPRISEFDQVAGRMMLDARSHRLKNGRLPPTKYYEIASLLDKAGFKLLKHLEGQFRKDLSTWNQKRPRQAVHSFCKSLEMDATPVGLSFLRRGVQRRLHRAESRWKRHLELSQQ